MPNRTQVGGMSRLSSWRDQVSRPVRLRPVLQTLFSGAQPACPSSPGLQDSPLTRVSSAYPGLKAAPCPCARRGTSDPALACWCPDVSPNLPAALQCFADWEAWAGLGPPWSPTHSLQASVYPHARLTDPWMFFHLSCLPGGTFILSLDLNSALPLASPVITCIE